MVLDFARFLVGNEFVVKEVDPNDDHIRIELSSGKTHHLLVILAEKACIPTSLVGAEKLRSLSIFKGHHAEEDETGELFSQPKHLRSLIFWGANVNGFPKEVGKLMHLKLLGLYHGKLKRLPEAICGLLNLEYLFLRYCNSLEELPDKIEKLVNLRCLDTTGSPESIYYPKGIGRLTSLRTLLGIVVICDHNDDEEFSLGDLENLCQLRSLALTFQHPQIDANEARRAKLQSKIHLKDIELTGRWFHKTERDNVSKVLNAPSHTNVICDPRFARLYHIAVTAYPLERFGDGATSDGETV
ncbi:hypothetical protein SLA2020_071110 [Shorea laevis]